MSDAIAARTPLHTAAAALIDQASAATIRAILRLLVNDLEPASAAPDWPVRLPPSATARPASRRSKRAATPAGAANGADPEWEKLRHQVRHAMRERGTSYADLAAAIGCAVGTAKVSLSRRQAASGPVQAGLRAWLEAVPEGVAAPALPFRSNQRRGNGAAAVARSPAADAAGSSA